jgi:hypothetical protein
VSFVVSSRALGEKRPAKYAPLFAFAGANGSRILSLPGAGIFDYQGVPSRYPVVSFLVRGEEKRTWRYEDAPSLTAGLVEQTR